MARSHERVNDTMGDKGWSLRMMAKSVCGVYCERGAGVAVKVGL